VSEPELDNALRDEARAAWHRFLDLVTPFRPQLHRYCRKLTGDVWDAEDLIQDTLLRAFATLGSVHHVIANPRGYLTRIATNLWLDGQRRRAAELKALVLEVPDVTLPREATADTRHAGALLFERLPPQERAAIVLKDVFDLSLKETAKMLSTSENAVKAALHRGRERLKDETPARRKPASRALVDEFVKRLDASDLNGLLALMLDSASIEMPGALLEVGRNEFERKGSWLWQAVHVHPDLPEGIRPPKWTNECVEYQGEPIVLGFMPTADGKLLQGITRFEEDDGRIARIRSYCFSPETAQEIAEAFGHKAGWIPYRFPTPAPGKSWSAS
jgi:RNA polymerase sigma-70 factor (ECF subfamily)